MWFVFELVIWPQEVTLARWTQPSGPLCLWQCLTMSVSLSISIPTVLECYYNSIQWFKKSRLNHSKYHCLCDYYCLSSLYNIVLLISRWFGQKSLGFLLVSCWVAQTDQPTEISLNIELLRTAKKNLAGQKCMHGQKVWKTEWHTRTLLVLQKEKNTKLHQQNVFKCYHICT